MHPYYRGMALHTRSSTNIDLRISTIPGRSMLGFHQPDIQLGGGGGYSDMVQSPTDLVIRWSYSPSAREHLGKYPRRLKPAPLVTLGVGLHHELVRLCRRRCQLACVLVAPVQRRSVTHVRDGRSVWCRGLRSWGRRRSTIEGSP